MDYDGNDFQSQNLRLAGEGSDKVSPVLRPYALPKYDFDESLHAPIRFDSSVDAEAFLGIESNEENQWIEDFSHTSSGIVFSATAAETCTILRRSNVWSEAASSESVEMLLKSVGQEEIIPGQSLNKAADACDELACIVKKMEPDLKLKSSPSQIEDFTHLNPTLQPDEILGKDDVAEQEPSCEVALQNKESNLSDGRDMDDGSVMIIGTGIPVADGCESADGKNNVPDFANDNIEVDGSCNDRKQETITISMHGIEDVPVQENNTVDENVNHLVEKVNVGGTDYSVHQEDDVEAQSSGNNSGSGVRSNRENDSKNEVGFTNDDDLEKFCTASLAKHSARVERDSETGFCSTTSEHTGNSENVVLSQQIDVCSDVHLHDAPALPLEAEAVLEVNEGRVSKTEIDSSAVHESGMELTINKSEGSKAEVDSSAVHESEMELTVNKSDSITEIENTDMLETDRPFELRRNQEVDPSISGSGSGNLSQVHSAVGDENESGAVISPKGSALSHLGSEAVNSGDDGDVSVRESPSLNLKASPELPHLPIEFAESKTADSKNLLSCKTVEQSLSVADDSNLGTENQQQVPNSGGATVEQKETSDGLHDSSVRENDVGQTKATSKSDEEVMVDKDVEPNRKDEETPLNLTPLLLKPPHLCTGVIVGGFNNTLASVDDNNMPISMPRVDGSSNLGLNGPTSSVPCTESQPKLGAKNDGKTSFDLDNASSGSPIVIRSSECSLMESKSEGAKISAVHMTQASEVVDAQGDRSLVSQNGNGNDASEAGRSFTFEVPPSPDTSQKDGKKWQPFLTTQSAKKTVEISPISRVSQDEAKSDPGAIHRTPQASGRKGVRSSAKISERKPRRAPGKSSTKETPKKGRTVKEASSARYTEKGDTTSHLPLNSGGILQPSEMQQCGQGECNNMKGFGVLSTSMSTLPDLNTQVSSSAAFQQPFTDLQQVQLRAQIFVYGALIQGAAPDEAYMISAFGCSDGGKSSWESAWRKCLERVHGQKSLLGTPETHLQSRLGNRAPDLAIKQSGNQSKVTPSSANRTTSRLTPATVANPAIPPSSPLWSMSTPHGDALQHAGVSRGAVMDFQHAVSPLHPHQITPVRNIVGHNASWASQSPYRAPWQSSNVETSTRFSVLPFAETVNLTPVRESSGLPAVITHSSSVNVPCHVASNPTAAKVLTGSPLIDMSKVSAIADKNYGESKPRKRKKGPVTAEAVQTQSHSQSQSEPSHSHSHSQSEPSSAPVVTTSIPAPLAIVTSSVSPKDHSKQGEKEDLRVTFSVGTLDKLKEAQKQAEDAAEFAAAAINCGQQIWNQLEEQKNRRLPLDVESKLSAATIAISAAAAVAKAAAAAANVASNAALQAKLMADEAFVSSGYGTSAQASHLDLRTLGQATPASILQGGHETSDASQSIITVAKEAARRRVEAASAAVKQAENINAIVRAAELAAEAVSQAGKVVAMGEPLPLSELVEGSSGAHWKTSLAASDPVKQSKGKNTEQGNRGGVAEGSGAFARHSEGLSDKTDHGVIAATGVDKKNTMGLTNSDRATSSEMVAGSCNNMDPPPATSQTMYEKKAEVSNEHIIKEGSRVEVLRGGDKVAWFTADVLSLRDGKACVCYHELLSEEGHKLEELVALEGYQDGAPRIRFARPITAMPFEGTRKRRRAAMGDNKWSVGDRVDAWMQDSWQEGVLVDNSQSDESSFMIHFPASGESSAVKAWNLRSSLIWENGSWVEVSNVAHNVQPSRKGDTPQEKRLKVTDTAVGTQENVQVPRSNAIAGPERPDDTRLLDLATNEKVFNIGRSSRDDIKIDSLRMTRTGLQKEGSKVIFGVPKPGKKRKFMEVSKHYVADKSSRGNESDGSLKFANYLMPQRSGPRGLKNDSNRESKDKRTTISKPKVSGKPPTVSGKIAPRKDYKSESRFSELDESKMRNSSSNSENELEKNEGMESKSFQSSEGASEDPILFSSVTVSSDAPSRKPSTSIAKSELLHKKKTGFAAGKVSKFEEERISGDCSVKASNEVTEPRRSNRKIQPTSRLLEGLQSSLIISKIPSVSHDKSQKSQRSKRD